MYCVKENEREREENIYLNWIIVVAIYNSFIHIFMNMYVIKNIYHRNKKYDPYYFMFFAKDI